MSDFIYIAAIILLILALFSIRLGSLSSGAIIVSFTVFLNLMLDNAVFELYNIGNLAGGFSVLLISMVTLFIFIVQYRATKEKILLKLSTVYSAFAILHLLYIGTYIADKNIFLGMIYHQYENIQFILTLYMISLFWNSGAGEIRNVFNRLRAGLNEPKTPSVDMDNYSRLHAPFNRLSSGLFNRRSKEQNKNNKRGVVR